MEEERGRMQVRDLRGRGAVQDQEFAMVEGSQIG
jgi:hypothetical protein